MSWSTLKDRSAEQVVTRSVANIFRTARTLGNNVASHTARCHLFL